jgi:lysyl-tRNA synthetase class I
MAGILDSAEIEIPCENCGRKTKKSIGWIKNHSHFTCDCGTHIILDASKFKGEISKVDRAIGDLQRTIDKINK